jgi:O-antigen/teichoic acid export membrane protein/GAF domain-containing protein
VISEELSRANQALRQQVQDLTNLRDAMLAIGSTFDRASILEEIINIVTKRLNFDRGLVLLFDPKKNVLAFGAYSHAAPDTESQFLLEQLQIDLEDAQKDRLLSQWSKGETILVERANEYLDTRLNWLIHTLNLQKFYSVPLQIGNQFKGVILVDNSLTQMPISVEQCSLLNTLAAHLAITLENARLYQLTEEQYSIKVQDLQILDRIDRELNYTLSVERVLNLTLDWVLRFTNIHAASVVLVDSEAEVMQFVAGYGFGPTEWALLKEQPWPLARGIIGRVARQGRYVVVPDVSEDPDYVQIVPNTRSKFAFPLTREDRVIAVLTMESPELDAFTEDNVDFVQRLAARAAIAVDNARLFDETRREHQKLGLVLSNIADAVIVIGPDGKLMLVNQAALATFKLPPDHDYTGRLFTDVFEKSALLPLYERARGLNQQLVEELLLDDGRTLHTSLVPTEQVGWIIVTHDVTPFKGTDKLKNESLATRLRGSFSTLHHQGQEWSFIRSSSVNSLGLAVGRVLGFAFTFVLARAYDADQYGYVVYVLMLASIMSVVVQPFGQHVMAYYIGKHSKDRDYLNLIMANAWSVWGGLIAVTLAVFIPLLVIMGWFSLGVVVVFVGTAAFYTYYGISSGFISSSRLLAVYVGSNIVQISLVVLVVFFLRVDSVTPTIFIYGLSYFVPLAAVILWAPLPLKFEFRLDKRILKSILRFSIPIWLSHFLYLGYSTSDIMFVEHFTSTGKVGIYGLTKTLSTVFYFFPMGIQVFLMPKIAGGSKEERAHLLGRSLATVFAVNMVGAALYLLLYRWFLIHVIDREYYDGLLFGFVMALAAILYGFHMVMTAAFVGDGRAAMETISRSFMMIIMIVCGLVLIPTHNIMGAALANLLSAAGGLMVYIVVGLAGKQPRLPLWLYNRRPLEESNVLQADTALIEPEKG